jgi:hypothetical protein
LSLLRSLGSPEECHIIADTSDFDGKDVSLEDAVAIADQHDFGVVVSCIPGKLAVFKHESPSSLYVLQIERQRTQAKGS